MDKKQFLALTGKRIKQYRKMRRLTQNRVADYTGVTKLQIINYEAGKCDIPASRLFSICECLKIPVGEVVLDQSNVTALPQSYLNLICYLSENNIDPDRIVEGLRENKFNLKS